MKDKTTRKPGPHIVIIACYAVFLGGAFISGFEPGKQIGANFFAFAGTMLTIVPFAFLLIGLFEVWVKRETVEKYLGEKSGLKGKVWAIILAGTMVGPVYVSLPIAHALRKKGAGLDVVFTYIGASAICRIPMATFEASFLGIEFTIVRLVVSLPLVVLSAAALGKYLTKTGYSMEENI